MRLQGLVELSTISNGSTSCFLRSLAGVAPCDTGFLSGQGRGNKLVTEEPKPVGSGRFRERSQDSSWILGTSFSPSFSLRQEPRLGSSSSRIDLTVLKSPTGCATS